MKFDSFKTYKYSYRKTGEYKVEKMKTLAIGGKGLNSFINMLNILMTRFIEYLKNI